MRTLLILLLGFTIGCSRDPMLVVTHNPNPCNRHSDPSIEDPPYPYMWYYRTEVRNSSDVPLSITSFESYALIDGKWRPNNVRGKPLNGDEFAEWYTEGEPCPKGVIRAGKVAVCDPNWHGASVPSYGPQKWVYTAVTPDGRLVTAETIIESVPIEN